jgi:hypothetical protein
LRKVSDDVRVQVELSLQFIKELGCDVVLVNNTRRVVGLGDEAIPIREDLGDPKWEVNEGGEVGFEAREVGARCIRAALDEIYLMCQFLGPKFRLSSI